jgi:uncharacterized membrane protein
VLLPLGIYMIPESLILLVLGMVWSMASNPKGAIKSLAGILAIVVIYIIAYTMADPTNNAPIPASAGIVKAVEAGLVTFVVLLAITLIAMIGSLFRDFNK